MTRLEIQMTNQTLEPLLNEKDIARLTKRSIASIRRDRMTGKGVPFIRMGKSVRYTADTLRSFLKSLERPEAE